MDNKSLIKKYNNLKNNNDLQRTYWELNKYILYDPCWDMRVEGDDDYSIPNYVWGYRKYIPLVIDMKHTHNKIRCNCIECLKWRWNQIKISSLIGLNKNLGYNTFINKNILSFLKPDRIIQKKLCDDWNSL